MNIAELIPQVFYDTIARFASGLVLIMTAGAIWFEESAAVREFLHTELREVPLAVTLVLIVISYVLAICFEGIRELTMRVGSLLPRWSRLQPRSSLQGKVWSEAWHDFREVYPDRASIEPSRPSEAVAIDMLRSLSPPVGSRIVKLRAEVAMCRTLWTGWAFILALYLALWALGREQAGFSASAVTTCIVTALALTVGISAVAVRGRAIDARHLRALYNHWLLLVIPGVCHVRSQGNNSALDVASQPNALLVSLNAIRGDRALNAEGQGERKLVVREVYDSIEKIATVSGWRPPEPGQKSAVLQTPNTEVAVFSEHAVQQRHFHKLAAEVYTVLEGEMEIEVDGDIFSLREGDMIAVRPGAIHEVRREGNSFISSVITSGSLGRRDKYVTPR